jgi:hypothetical protein
MATCISPRPGFTPHPLTIDAANQMIHLVERASQFRERPPAAIPYERTAAFNEDTWPALFPEKRSAPRRNYALARLAYTNGLALHWRLIAPSGHRTLVLYG